MAHKLGEFENPISGKEDSAFSPHVWLGYIVGFAVLLTAAGVAMWLIDFVKGKLGGLVPAGITIPGLAAQPKPTPANAAGAGLMVYQ